MKCYCGAKMILAGTGKYPYACAAADRYPMAMVYIGCENGHTCWTSEGMVSRCDYVIGKMMEAGEAITK